MKFEEHEPPGRGEAGKWYLRADTSQAAHLGLRVWASTASGWEDPDSWRDFAIIRRSKRGKYIVYWWESDDGCGFDWRRDMSFDDLDEAKAFVYATARFRFPRKS